MQARQWSVPTCVGNLPQASVMTPPPCDVTPVGLLVKLYADSIVLLLDHTGNVCNEGGRKVNSLGMRGRSFADSAYHLVSVRDCSILVGVLANWVIFAKCGDLYG